VERKIRVAVIYKKNYIFFDENHFDKTTSYFFKDALRRNESLEVSYFPCENEFDVSKLKGKYDVILLVNNGFDATPETLHGIKQSNIPVISKQGDPHYAKKFNLIELHEKFKIDAYWSFQPKEYFYKFYPKHFRYKEIIWGLEPSKYQNLKPYNQRIKNRILNSGNVGRNNVKSKIGHFFSKNLNSSIYYYKLRTMCNDLSYVDYSGTVNNQYTNQDYPEYLSRYCTAIAAGTFSPAGKYFEIPAAGCMSFMEVTPKNHAKYLGFKNNETAIFIDEKNYKNKFEEYLSDSDNKRWSEIAKAGREYALNELNNDKAVESLIQLMKEFIK